MGEITAVNRRGLLGLILGLLGFDLARMARRLNCLWRSEVENSGEVEKGGNERLPFDLVVEILAWLPVKSLIKFRCVCNQWRNLFLDPTFVSLQAERSKHIYFYRDHVNLQITQCVCESLLLVANNQEKRCYVCNPSIHQTFQLPLNKQRGVTYLNISCVPEHKVVATTQENRCLVVVVGTPTSSWKDLGFIPNHCGGTRFYPVMSVYNVLHWVFTNNSTGDVNVVSLDPFSENFNVKIAPKGLSRFAVDNYPMWWEGCFALVRIVKKEMVVWILRDVKNDIWEKEIVWLTSLNFELGGENFRPLSKKRGNGWITFYKYPNEFYYYHQVTNRSFPASNVKISYKPSLVSCNSPGPMPEWFKPLLSKLKL